ncbi:MAG: hypothetical protein ABNH38_06475, partial [Tateyamaria sp.]
GRQTTQGRHHSSRKKACHSRKRLMQSASNLGFSGNLRDTVARSEHHYDAKGNLTESIETVVRVFDVMEDSDPPKDFFN